MKSTNLFCESVNDTIQLEKGKQVIISVVAYQHPYGVPARLFAGFTPAIKAVQLCESIGIEARVRIVDPSTIANYCNSWNCEEGALSEIISELMNTFSIDFTINSSKKVTEETLALLDYVSEPLKSTSDPDLRDHISRIALSGRNHGNDDGERNTYRYMAAHPFSWLDMQHHLLWENQFESGDVTCLNFMSRPESRFSKVRDFLKRTRPEFLTDMNPTNYYMQLCRTPCYIRLEDEPTFVELHEHGYEVCLEKYKSNKNKSENHRRALRDFESLSSILM